jgi:hypothetical protein
MENFQKNFDKKNKRVKNKKFILKFQNPFEILQQVMPYHREHPHRLQILSI